jgi:ATP-binding cassette subfamily B protein
MLTFVLLVTSVVAGLAPTALAWVGARIIDGVAVAAASNGGGAKNYSPVVHWILAEALLLVALTGAQRGINYCQSVLRTKLGHRVNMMILEKALTLELKHFEDSAFYDKLARAYREATIRPIALVKSGTIALQNAILLASTAMLVLAFSPWAVLILVAGGLPVFIGEARFAGAAFNLGHQTTSEWRKQQYLEATLSRGDHVKEVKLLGLGKILLDRYVTLYQTFFRKERALASRRETWGFLLGMLNVIALYGAYFWIAIAAVNGAMSVGEMVMYLLLLRFGQTAVTGMLSATSGMFEDFLYFRTLFEYLEQPAEAATGTATKGLDSTAGLQFENVGFTYPGAAKPAIVSFNLHIRRGQTIALVGANGSGKTTLIKLLTGLYRPTSGRVLLDGRDLRDWDANALRSRIGVIFQDFVRYHFTVGENIGLGDVRELYNQDRWRAAAASGNAASFVERLPEQYSTQLGRLFEDGRELSGGEWQRIAVSRAFMRVDADILVLDEPTAAMDASTEAEVFERFHAAIGNRMTIIISHRFSTVRTADHIVVLDGGQIAESGSHALLMKSEGLYAKLFALQARNYQ